MIDARILLPMLALLPAAAFAQDSGRASDRALAPLVACRPIGDVRARALCYDAALDRLQQAVSGRQVVIVDKQQAAVDRKAMFGFSLARPQPEPRARDRRGTPVEEPLAAIDSAVVVARPFGYEQWSIRLANGATWRTVESGIAFEPKPGEVVHIRRGVMGSYMLRVGKGRSVRAARAN